MRFIHKKSLTFIKLRGWGYVRYAGEIEMEESFLESITLLPYTQQV